MYAGARKFRPVKWSNGACGVNGLARMLSPLSCWKSTGGLRIRDAAPFDMERLNGNEWSLRMHKTGKPLFTWLPDELVNRLRSMGKQHGNRPFMTPGGSTRIETVADLWRRKLNKGWALWEVGRTSASSPFPTHVRPNSVANDVTPADVAELAGDTEEMVRKHYARWVPERQERLTRVLEQARTLKVSPPYSNPG